MKKSDMSVSMPMSTYEELMDFRKKYLDLLNEINSCFNFTHFVCDNMIDFVVDEALEMGKRHLSVKYRDAIVCEAHRL